MVSSGRHQGKNNTRSIAGYVLLTALLIVQALSAQTSAQVSETAAEPAEQPVGAEEASVPWVPSPLDPAKAPNGDWEALAAASPGVLINRLPEPFERWLDEVDPLITHRERALFLSLNRDYQREAFIHKFWKVRDPYPRTARNEMKERWPYRVAQARSSYDHLDDARSRILLVHGQPTNGFSVGCTQTRRPAEVWAYAGGSDHVDFPFLVIFLVPQNGSGKAQVWRPYGGGLFENLMRRIRTCQNGARLTRLMMDIRADAEDYERRLGAVLAKPRPSSEEWVYTFIAHSTDLPPDAEPLEGEVEIAYPGRHQLRTVAQGLITVPADQAGVQEYAGYRSYDFQLTGEVLREDGLFESFRYKYGFPEGETGERIPMAFQRYLRPGDYKLILLLKDLNTNRVFREERNLSVPQTETIVEAPTFRDVISERLFEEAARVIAAGETAIRIVRPQGQLHTGLMRFDAVPIGDEIKKVRFSLDDRPILTKNRPPYNVEIDLGDYPDLRNLRVDALNVDGEEVATDEILINGGGYRFVAKLVEPRQGRSYDGSLRARVEVELPEGRSLDHLELYLNETLVATLYQEPFVHPIVLPENQEITYVRAVAYLPDGNSTEDMVFINTPENLFDEVEVQFVELYTSVLDKEGRPIEGLGQANFKVEEDGVRQEIARFEKVRDQSIHAGILIDNSASMAGTLSEVRKAALSFFNQAITPKDRAAVITFNRFPNLAVELTNDRARLGSGLAGLVAEGQTALYDSVMFGLYYFTGIKGQRAILILSDGKDESSRFSFEETLDYARRAGITLYSIGFRLFDSGAKSRLRKLADETGGQSFFIQEIEELVDVYSLIQRELRSQYLIAYQSSNTSDDREFRQVELKVDRPDAVVKTLSGYYP